MRDILKSLVAFAAFNWLLGGRTGGNSGGGCGCGGCLTIIVLGLCAICYSLGLFQD